jgi:hypothetical protein
MFLHEYDGKCKLGHDNCGRPTLVLTVHGLDDSVCTEDAVIATGMSVTLLNKRMMGAINCPVWKSKAIEVDGLWCDLRKVPFLSFCDYTVEDAVVATPCEDTESSNILGMNVLSNFNFGFDANMFYLSAHGKRIVTDELVCGKVYKRDGKV